MRRVVSVWLPTWATDRRRRRDRPLPETLLPETMLAEAPLVLSRHDGRRQVVAACDRAARTQGLRPGMPLAHARALLPGLRVEEATPEADAAALGRLAAWALRYTPMTAADPYREDGIWLDTTGADHLRGGEAALLEDLVARLAEDGVAACAAIADTPGAAHAVARFGGRPATVVPPGTVIQALAPLPVAALRLEAEIAAGLVRLGFETIGALAAAPRAPLARRFGAGVLTRLDQALDRLAEPISPVLPPELVAHRLAFLEPIVTAEAFATVIGRLVAAIAAALERRAEGGRRFDLMVERVDGSCQAVRIGTVGATRDAAHLARLLGERIESIDPGLGVEAMRLAVPLTEPLAYRQDRASLGQDQAFPEIAPLIDLLQNRLGPNRIYRMAPVESDVPERSVAKVPPLSPPCGTSWPAALPRPTRLLRPPERLAVMALLPDHPPAAFTWRRVQHRIRRADGPERIFGEWWRSDAETTAVRDYFRVEDEQGRRFWLFRQGDGIHPETGDLTWYLHGVFA